VATRLPARDLGRARRFYAERLGPEPVDERPGGLLHRCEVADFVLFRSTGASSGTFTRRTFEVDDIEGVVAELKRRAWCSKTSTCPGSAPPTASPTSTATTRARVPSPNAEPVSAFGEGDLLGVGEPVA
jgi:catechol 2,3-dioxygenase-like lactoylglutathione lyase family enzyme